MIKIDAHQHFWDLERFEYPWLQAASLEPIRQNYLPVDLRPHLDQCGIDYSIFVQTRHHLDETRWVLDLCAEYPFLAGVVGWVDLQSPECEQQLEELQAHPKFLGVRHVIQDEPDDNFAVQPETLRGLKILERRGVPFDLLFYVKHLPHAVTIAQTCPDLTLVLDHLAKPRIKEHSLTDWEQPFRAAAECPNISCKLSGLVTEADWENWSVDDFRPYLEIALEAFGPARLMFGSDWPVCELAASYTEVYGLIVDTIGELSTDEQAEIVGGTAARVYGIEMPPPSPSQILE
jgi:L-fuconolactonase